ncbi:MAG: TonB-dependent receptor [Acidobacteria bacterium]|nr:TonB-dependent receptor [Acidobacteriota bacterium]
MGRNWVLSTLIVSLLAAAATPASGQTGAGALRGTVQDEQGGALPGVTVTATSPDAIAPAVAVSDESGNYRLLNLPPGSYVVTAELTGFSVFRREEIVVRAGATFQVDVVLRLGTLQETLTVTADSPMIEVSKASNVLNVDGEFQRQMPIAARKNWTDFLEMTPGVHSRPFDDGSGRMVYFGHATEHFAHVANLEGMQAGNYNDFQLTYVQMGSDMIQDIETKTGGVDASTPMGTGLAINVITKSGGNQFRGSLGYAYQPLESGLNGDNSTATTTFGLPAEIQRYSTCPNFECTSTGGVPVRSGVKQIDASIGGPIKKDRVWFFGSFRWSDVETAISRIDKQVSDIRNFFPDASLFNQKIEGTQPYVKVTSRLGSSHELAAFYQNDRTNGQSNWEYFYGQINGYSNGGNLISGKLSSAWGSRLTTTFLVGYNNKGSNDDGTFDWLNSIEQGTGPNVGIYQSTRLVGGLITGTGLILEGGNRATEAIGPASVTVLRGDLTYYKSGWKGSHEFQTGFFIQPRNTYDTLTRYTNDGFYLEARVPVDYGNPSLGTVPFRRQYADPIEITTRQAVDQNWAFYLQDSWKPSGRLTLNLGLRMDYVKREDKIFDITRQRSWTTQPRFGAVYLLTADAKNILRGTVVRVGEQMMGRDAITSFGGSGTVNITTLYDNNLDGVFETERFSAASTPTLATQEFDPNNHQPWVDEWIVGYRRQFPWQTSLDVGFISRSYKHTWATVEINGFWPEAPGQPFGGFGRVDPERGEIERQTNNTWSTLEYRAIEMTLAKNMSNGFQVMAGFNRQWHHMDGTWNPTDKARFIAPDAFPNDANLYMPRGNNDRNSLPETGNALSYGPTWMKYRFNVSGLWRAPFGISVAGSYALQAGPWSGAILYQLPANDPDIMRFGPTTFRSPGGRTFTNPLSTRNRYLYPTRGEGQIRAPGIHTVGLKVGKRVSLGGPHSVELSLNVLNLLNGGDFTQFSYNSAYQSWSPNFLQMRNRQSARQMQFTAVYRF